MIETLSVLGLGKLGTPVAACIAAKGFRVIGVDVDAKKVEAFGHGIPPVSETGLERLLAQVTDGRLVATCDAEEAVLLSDTTLIFVPTPSTADGSFSLDYVLSACRSIGAALREKGDFHLIVVSSTVMPGSTEGPILSALEAASGKRCGDGFGLCYSPEFVALGSVIRDFTEPDFILIGESDERSGSLLEGLYGAVCEGAPPVARLSIVNAEIAKLAVNTFVTTKISFANMLARICEQMPGGDVTQVAAALGLDKRIGEKCLQGAISYGGPCLPRDNAALVALARAVGADAPLAECTDRSNREQIAWLTQFVKAKTPPGGTVGILGLAYKPDTDVVIEAPGLLLAQALIAGGVSVVAYDPAAMDNARHDLDGNLRFASSAAECIETADVTVITTPWREFSELEWPANGSINRSKLLIDCWRITSGASSGGVRRLVLGTADNYPDPTITTEWIPEHDHLVHHS